ncbi:DUF6442 family protein [[Clostridium] innocuum]|uniref:DUF6442 family protein n=1 Tax=Clostridium innocuum TaxID=1522 RepID=UPI00158DB057|nr:DUF6442 family protein [[Clostridium] innocuum]
MKQTQRTKPIKDERDQHINIQSKARSLEYVIAATQVLTIMCLIKGNPAWKGSFSLLFFGIAFELLYKYEQYIEKLYRQVGVIFLLIGILLMGWFGITA